MQQQEQEARDEFPGEVAWNSLPFLNPHRHFLSVGPRFKTLAAVLLAPQVLALVYGMLPRGTRHGMTGMSVGVMLLSAASGLLFLLALYLFRSLRRQRQLALNASLADAVPGHFVLYLRSFRRSGALFVPNRLPGLVDRRLMGNSWDIELALSLCLTQKLPLVSMGVRPDGMGSMQLQAEEDSWQESILDLARRSEAIFLVLDERPSTLWEFESVLADAGLRQKLIVVMPPEQYGWWRRLRRLPTVAASWAGIRRQVGERHALPDYMPEGRLMLADDTGQDFVGIGLANFHPPQVRRVVCAAIERGRGMAFHDVERLLQADTASTSANAQLHEGWRSFIDPVWPVVFVAANMAATLLGASAAVPVQPAERAMFAASVATLVSLVISTMAFTAVRPPLAVVLREQRLGPLRAGLHADRYTVATWLGLYRAPDTVRTAINYSVLLVGIFIIRQVVLEPFRTPSASMAPTLVVGDLLVVNKAAYGIRLPLTRTLAWTRAGPQRGDLVALAYPLDTQQIYIERVVGLPGDTVTYHNKKLAINGSPVRYRALPPYLDEERLVQQEQAEEFLGSTPHRILYRADLPSVLREQVLGFPGIENCKYDDEGFICKVPAARYFVLGDSRDNSYDSRYWGFVPADYIIGKPVAIWTNLNDMSRVGAIR